MIDYATIANISGAFPNVVSLNSTGPGNLDGTPYIKSVIDDLWGASQGLMDAAGLTPDAVTESATASQRLEALRLVLGYPGEVIPWMGDAADPSVLGIRLLPLNGQGVLVASYPELEASTWVGTTPNLTASAFFRADDASGATRNPVGVYLILPDLRGTFMRGLDVSGTVDPGGAIRDIGNFQDWAIYDHQHGISDDSNPMYIDVFASAVGTKKFGQTSDSGSAAVRVRTSSMWNSTFSAGTPAANMEITESRPKNHTCRWCIRY